MSRSFHHHPGHPGPGGPEGHHGPHHGPHHMESTIVLVQGETVGLANPEGWTKTIQVDGSTRIHRGPEISLQITDLRVGQNVHVHDDAFGPSHVARDIDVLPGVHADGQVLNVSNGVVTVQDRSGVTYSAAALGRVHSGRLPVSLAQVSAGQHVIVDGDMTSEGTLAAYNVDFPELYRPYYLAFGLSLLAGSGALAMRRLKKAEPRETVEPREMAVYQPGLYD